MKTLRIFLLVLLSLTLVQCSDSTTNKTMIEKAWVLFENGDYESALTSFQALMADTSNTKARVGAGWASLRLGYLTDAIQYFDDSDTSDVDALAGYSFAAWALYQPVIAIEKADKVLAMGSYVFTHDNRVDSVDLYWIQASSYLQLLDYPKCVEKIKLIEPSYSVDLNAVDIEQLLLQKLQNLGIGHLNRSPV